MHRKDKRELIIEVEVMDSFCKLRVLRIGFLTKPPPSIHGGESFES